MRFPSLVFSCSLVRTPREGVLDLGKLLFFIFICVFTSLWLVLVTLKTISSFARIQTVAIDKKSTTADAFQLLRKCVCIPRHSLLKISSSYSGKDYQTK